MKTYSTICDKTAANSAVGRCLLMLLLATMQYTAAAQTARIVFQAPVTFHKPAPKPATYTYQEIFSINPDGTGLAPLTTLAASAVGPRWSPGQAYVSFCRNSGLWVMEARGEANGGRSFRGRARMKACISSLST